MPHIFPLHGQKHSDLTRELTDLGGTRQETFRLAFAWDGEHYFEVTENTEGIELYEKWIAAHSDDGGAPPETDNGSPDPATGGAAVSMSPPEVKAVEASVQTEVAAPIGRPEEGAAPEDAPIRSDETAATAEEPEPVSALDTRPLSESAGNSGSATVIKTPESRAEAPSTSDSSTTGTTRKRSAKNSNRRP